MTAPAWTRRGDLVAVEGGPKGGQWFYRADWDALVQAAAYMRERTGVAGRVLGYQLTDRIATHPHYGGCVGHVAVWTGRGSSPHQGVTSTHGTL